MIIITLDFYHSNFSITFDNKSCFWNNKEEFISDTNFPYGESVKLLSYEPSRNLYIIEKELGQTSGGPDSEEMQWITDNLLSLETLVNSKQNVNIFIPTLEMERSHLLFATDWLLQRHQEENLLGIPNKLTTEQITSVLNYRQQLRDLTSLYSKDTPVEEVTWPVYPLS